MTEAPPADPEWITMRAQHQQECAAFGRQVETEKKAMHRRHDTENQNFTRRVEEVKAELLARHSQQEGAYWARYSQKQSKTSSLAPTPPSPQPPALTTQATTIRPSAAPATASRQKPLPYPNHVKKHSPFKAFDEHKQNEPGTATTSATQQRAEEQMKQSTPSRRVLQQIKKEASTGSTGASRPLKPIQPKPNAADPRSKASSKKDIETIDLCTSDDDMLVEVSQATYKKKPTPSVAYTPFRPPIPVATFQLCRNSSQKPTPNLASTPIKPEKHEVAQPSQGRPQPHLPQHSHNGISKAPTSFHSTILHDYCQDHGTAAFNALSSIASGTEATTITPLRPAQPLPLAVLKKEPLPFGKDTVTPANVQKGQVQDISKLTINRATIVADNDPFTLQQPYQNGSFAKYISKNEQARASVTGSSDRLDRRNSDGYIDIEDVPLALLNVKAILRKLSATTSGSDSMDVDSPTADVTKCSIAKKDVQKTHLPSPSPSLASASSTSAINEATALLNKFKKPTLPSTSGETPAIRARTVESQASSCTFVTAPDKAAPLQRQASAISQSSSVSTLSRKRKRIDLSDDEQSDYLPSEPYSVTARKKLTTSLGSPLRKFLESRGPPPPSASHLSPAGKRTNGFGFRTNPTPASPHTPLTPPRPSRNNATPPTPITPTRSALDARAKALSTPPSKRKAAVRAQSEVQKIIEASEQFHTEDEIYRASARELASHRGDARTAELGTRLRSMSITPVPTGTRFNNPRQSTAREESTRFSRETGGDDQDGVYTRSQFLRDRATGGDRLANRNRNISSIIGDDSDDDDMEDMDTSEFFCVGGVILQNGQEGRLTEM